MSPDGRSLHLALRPLEGAVTAPLSFDSLVPSADYDLLSSDGVRRVTADAEGRATVDVTVAAPLTLTLQPAAS